MSKQYKNEESARVSKWQRTPQGKLRHLESHRNWRARHPKRCLLESARKRAKRDGRECTVTEHDFEIPIRCPILGIELKKGSGKPVDSSPTLDRIDSARGYVPGNVIVTSFRANTLRKNGTISEFQAIIAWLENLRVHP